MTKCPKCGNVLTKEMIDVNMCWECGKVLDESILDDAEREEIAEQAIQNNPLLEYEKLLSEILVTSGYNFETYRIDKYIGIVSGEVVLGTGFLSEYKASFADLFGVESDSFATKLEQAKEAAMVKLLKKASDKGANAIIGVDFDYITLKNNMIGVSANGTAVVVVNE